MVWAFEEKARRGHDISMPEADSGREEEGRAAG